MSDKETTANQLVVSDDKGTVGVRKIFTRMGERLEMSAYDRGTSIELDAIMLESVSWQTEPELAERAASLERRASADTPHSRGETGKSLTVSSPYAEADVRKTDEASLEIVATKLGYSVHIGVRELEWLTAQDDTIFREWLETPFGPASEELGHGH